jgi:photosystem II stability/assembly factor-like uncharacterized protein
MFKFLGKRKWLVIFPLVVMLVVASSIIVDVEFLCAHSPHDVIEALDISPTYDQDSTLFIVIADHLLKSIDGGFSWKELVQGLDNKYYFSSVVISPGFEIDQTVFVSSDGDGIYKSQDGGTSWDEINWGLDDLVISMLAISPEYASDEVVLATGVKGGLYKTSDGGESWYEVIDEGIKVTAIAFSSDLSWDLIVVGDDEGQMWFSDDEGETWEKSYQIAEGGRVTAIAISEQVSKDGTIFVGTEQRGVFKTVDGGASFVELKGGLSRYSLDLEDWRVNIRPPDHHVMSLALSPNYGRDGTIFASTWWKAVFKSDNGGKTWKKHDTGVTCDGQANTEAYKLPHFKHLRVSKTFEEDGTVFLGGFDGLFKSTDGGRTWAQLETLPLRLIKGMGVSPADKGEFSVTIATYGGGAYTTSDQGVTWAINNNGLKTTRLVDVTFSPAYGSDNTVFSGASTALLRSTDGADNWDRIELNKVENRGRPYPTFIVLSPNFATDQTLYFGTRVHGIFKSIDGGLNSSVIWTGMGKVINSLVMSPDFITDGTLFASVRGEGVYKTEDWGETWQSANNGLMFIETWRSAAPPQICKKDVLLVISPNYKKDKTLFAGSARAEGLFKTTDGGASWQKLAGIGYGEDAHIIGMAISPNYENDEALVISVRGKGLFKTDNGGINFVEIGSDLIDNNYAIELIEFSTSYATDNTIYAASDEELFKSTDGGNTWEMITRPVRYENMREVVRYEGEWRIANGDDFSASSVSHSDVAHNEAILNFVGTGISWIGTTSNDQGIAEVYVDGDYMADVDQFSDTRATMVKVYSITDLAYAPHTIIVEVTGTKNPKSTGYRIEIDAFDVLP